MSIAKKTTLVFAIIFSTSIYSQDYYGIVFPNNNRNQVCQTFQKRFSGKPNEIKFSIQREGQKLYFTTNNKNWLSNLIKPVHLLQFH